MIELTAICLLIVIVVLLVQLVIIDQQILDEFREVKRAVVEGISLRIKR